MPAGITEEGGACERERDHSARQEAERGQLDEVPRERLTPSKDLQEVPPFKSPLWGASFQHADLEGHTIKPHEKQKQFIVTRYDSRLNRKP